MTQPSNMKELEPIIRYKMSELEAKAFKIALMWQDECRREIPSEPHAKVTQGSDPRKSLLFKYCFKLARETSGILAESDVSLYIRSQIQVLKSINDGRMHALIEPSCLVGEKAWRRWKLWKSRYDRRISCPRNSAEASVRPTEGKIRSEIEATKEFLRRMGCFSPEGLESKSSDMPRWIKSGEVSCFYVVLSPWVKKIIGDPMKMDFDFFYYRASITPSTEQFFRDAFTHEFEVKTCQKA